MRLQDAMSRAFLTFANFWNLCGGGGEGWKKTEEGGGRERREEGEGGGTFSSFQRASKRRPEG